MNTHCNTKLTSTLCIMLNEQLEWMASSGSILFYFFKYCQYRYCWISCGLSFFECESKFVECKTKIILQPNQNPLLNSLNVSKLFWFFKSAIRCDLVWRCHVLSTCDALYAKVNCLAGNTLHLRTFWHRNHL